MKHSEKDINKVVVSMRGLNLTEQDQDALVKDINKLVFNRLTESQSNKENAILNTFKINGNIFQIDFTKVLDSEGM